MARRRILIAGAGGLLGHELAGRLADAPWRDLFEGVALSHADLDVTDAAAVGAALDARRPSVVVNCAGYTRVDDAEGEVLAATRLNAEAPGLLAGECAARGVGLVHLSTDYVFDGRKPGPYVETDPVGPLSVYGRTKAAGERAVAAAYEAARAERWLVVRSQWLYGAVGSTFVKTVLARARAGEALRVVDDQWGAPTWGRDLADALLALVDAGGSGIVHVANDGRTTWFGVARAILEICGLAGSVALEPAPTSAVRRPARRPAYGVLDCARYRRLTGRTMRPWREALEQFLETLT